MKRVNNLINNPYRIVRHYKLSDMKVKKLKEAFINQLNKQRIKLTEEQKEEYFNDFRQYCKEMCFTNKAEIIDGAKEYVLCQIHYGIFR